MRGSGKISLGCRIVGISSRNIICDGWGLACRLGRVRTVPTGDLPPAARSRGAAPHPAGETFPIFSRHLRAAVFLLLLTFISSVAHSLEEHGIDMDEFIAMAVQDALHPKIPEVEGKEMENMRTLAFQAPESLFQRVKRYLERNQMTQKAEEEQNEAPVNK